MAAKILLRPVAGLRPHAGKARVHSAAQLEQSKASILAFGFTNPLLVDEDGVLIAGHGRLEAAAALGMAKVPVIVLRHLSPAQKEALRLADNRIAENATWDQALLRDALASRQAAEIDLAALGFSADELVDILAAAGDAVSDGDAPEALSAADAEGVPAAASAITATGITGGVRLSGGFPADAVRLQVFEAASNSLAAAIKLVTEPTSLFWDRTGLTAGQTRWHWLRSVSAEGNVSAFAGPVTATAL